MTRPWLALHVFHAGDQDRLLLEAVHPTLNRLAMQAAVSRFFFIRYWNGGPHLRVRVECLEPLQVETVLRHDLEHYLSLFPGGEPDALQYAAEAARVRQVEAQLGADAVGASEPLEDLQPADSIQARDYRFDERRYGRGDASVDAHEHAWASSRLALAVLEVARGDLALTRTFALHAAAITAGLLEAEPAQSAKMFDEASQWDAPGEAVVDEDRWRRVGLEPFETQRSSLGNVRALMQGGSVAWPDYWSLLLQAWKGELLRRRGELIRLRNEADGREPDLLLFDALHLLCNRLGLGLSGECYIYHLVAGLLREDSSERTGSAEAEPTAEKYWGRFAAMRDSATLGVEEVEPFSGLAAELYDQMSIKGWDEAEYVRLAQSAAGPVLELGCGTGRILLQVAEAGHPIVGLDHSEPMLAILRDRLMGLPEAVRGRVQLVCADARDFELGLRYRLILLPYLTLGLLSGRADQQSVLDCSARHLDEEGLFVFDFLTVLDGDAPSLAGQVVDREFSLRGRPVAAEFGVKYLERAGAIVVNACFRVDDEGTETRRYLLSMQVEALGPVEVQSMLERAGLVVVRRRSEDFPDGALRRTVITCRRRSPRTQPLWQPYHPRFEAGIPPITLVEGKGCEVVDDKGNRYLDASGGLWSVQCGLGQREIVGAVTQQLRRLSYGTLFLGRATDTAVELSRQLVAMAMSPLEHVYLTGSGSESVELAIKLARSFFNLQGRPGKSDVLYLDASYHGTFFGSVGVSGLVPEKSVFAPLLPGLHAVRTPLPDDCPAGVSFDTFALGFAQLIERRLEQIGGQVAALILEPVLGSAGVVILPRSYLECIARACRKHDVLLIVDEVATGFGRTGRWFASEHSGLRPDIMLLGKGINSGYLPLGAVLFSAEIGETLNSAGAGIVHGSSHNGNPACCAAAIATFDLLRRRRLVERSKELGEYFLSRLLARRHLPGLGAARGLGLMLFCGLTDESGAAANQAQVLSVCRSMQMRGVLAYPAPGGLMFMPALIISKRQVDEVLACLEAVLQGNRLVGGALEGAQAR